MNCEEVKLLLCDTQLNESVQEHLAGCADCRNFRNDMQKLLNSPAEFKTTAELDRKVLDFAKENRPSKKSSIIQFYWIAAVAAILVIGLFVYKGSGTSEGPGGDNIAEDNIIEKNLPDNEIPNNEMIVENIDPESVDDLQMLIEDDILNDEITAMEGELLVFGSDFLE